MKIALAQVNTTVADLSGNVERCLDYTKRAAALGSDLVLFPELTIPGYPPRDILLDKTFILAVQEATLDLTARLKGFPPVIVGSLAPSSTTLPHHPNQFNAAYLLQDGKARLVACKRLLPVYDVFLEPRWFVPGSFMPPVEINGCKVGVLICEDMWDDGYSIHPAREQMDAGADVLVCISASPYRLGVHQERIDLATRHHIPFLVVNLVGATDELIFDGRSFGVNHRGEFLAQAPAYQADILMVEPSSAPVPIPASMGTDEDLFRAISLGIHDFARKNNLRQAFLGLSGGVDSALVAVLAASALGPENVAAVAIPSRYTDPRSTEYAHQLAENLKMELVTIPLESMQSSVENALGEILSGGVGAENVQARLRMLVLMALVNKSGGFLLNTSNKTEIALGYSTLYGDTAGTLAPIADLNKPQIYSLARWINREKEVIPQFIIDRPPSAELRPGQVDPFDYDRVSPQMDALVLDNQSDEAMKRSEHKRWQMGIGLKVSEKAFGTGRLIPVSRR